MRIAFVVISFPALSETFILNQIIGLIDRGHQVDIFATGLPVVASPVGVNKNFIIQSEAGLTAEKNKDWVKTLSTLIENKSIRAEQSLKAQDYARQFDISVTGRKLVKLFRHQL